MTVCDSNNKSDSGKNEIIVGKIMGIINISLIIITSNIINSTE